MVDYGFQRRVAEWLGECFPSSGSADKKERAFRFLEEALELAQAVGCNKADAHQLVNYVFSRPTGRPEHEVGGVMVTLAGLCTAAEINMNDAANRELERNWVRIDAIRRKQASKPLDSPLPQ